MKEIIFPEDLAAAHQLINQQILENAKLKAELAEYVAKVTGLESQIQWFQKQLFGPRSEKRISTVNENQLCLGEHFKSPEPKEEPVVTVAEHKRRPNNKQPLAGDCGESGLRFGSGVEIKEIELPIPEIEGLKEGEFEIVDQKIFDHIAQRRSGYYIKRYVKKVVKILKSGEMVNSQPAPAVIERSFADVTLLAGVLIDKFAYHLPLYRIHQRLAFGGITVSRGTLTYLVHAAGNLLEPVYKAQVKSVLGGHRISVDETPIKVRKENKESLQRGYYWPIYGDRDEIVFHYADSRAAKVLDELLKGFKGVLLTDGYAAYDKYAAKVREIIHALCWTHTRREFIEAEGSEPARVTRALDLIGKLYETEAEICKRDLVGEAKLKYRLNHAKPVVDELFEWLRKESKDLSLLPKSTFMKACNYALERESGLRIFLSDPEIPLDTNELERGLRVIPLGRKNWLFCMSEVGAKYVGIIQSLIVTCKLQNIDPFIYLLDVLPRLNTYPASRAQELTPRFWKEKFLAEATKKSAEHWN